VGVSAAGGGNTSHERGLLPVARVSVSTGFSDATSANAGRRRPAPARVAIVNPVISRIQVIEEMISPKVR